MVRIAFDGMCGFGYKMDCWSNRVRPTKNFLSLIIVFNLSQEQILIKKTLTYLFYRTEIILNLTSKYLLISFFRKKFFINKIFYENHIFWIWYLLFLFFYLFVLPKKSAKNLKNCRYFPAGFWGLFLFLLTYKELDR